MRTVNSMLVTILAIASAASALGINCRGSSQCGAACEDHTVVDIQGTINQAVENGKGNTHFKEGDHISCSDHCCAFWQKGASGSLSDALTHVTNIKNHGCKICGSDPISGNDVSKGELTINYVSDVSCNSPCLTVV